MKTRLLFALTLIATVFAAKSAFAQKEKPLTIKLKAGESYHVLLTEVLYIRQQTSQVDSALVEPSTRTSVYNFTENIEKVDPDGSAIVSATLDSFTTRIIVGKIEDRNEIFRFNSNNDYDLQNRLRDIRALPRAQFLGQALKYRLGADGLIKNFENLSSFQMSTYARNFEYDMLHAMMSLSDSLRIGQLLEQGFGAIAAFSDGNNGTVQTPYTVAEIRLTRKLTAHRKGNEIDYSGTFSDVPDKIDYLEGIAYPMNLDHFVGGCYGSVVMKDGIVTSGSAVDTAKMDIHIDTEPITNQIVRHVSFEREPLKMIHGGTVKIKEIESHHTPPKETKIDDDTNTKVIELHAPDSTAHH
ncbi:MAG: hypothetical protein Q8896_05950 [Bacteroidota bacterium]|nr:hypothetical protein [Bacteroidota bacterium]